VYGGAAQTFEQALGVYCPCHCIIRHLGPCNSLDHQTLPTPHHAGKEVAMNKQEEKRQSKNQASQLVCITRKYAPPISPIRDLLYGYPHSWQSRSISNFNDAILAKIQCSDQKKHIFRNAQAGPTRTESLLLNVNMLANL
jgi:hypothetical protein